METPAAIEIPVTVSLVGVEEFVQKAERLGELLNEANTLADALASKMPILIEIDYPD